MNEIVTKDTKEALVKLTDRAVKELKRIMVQENIPETHSLRVGVKGGGCSGFEYIFRFDLKEDLDDNFVSNGIQCHMNKAHAIYLLGIEVDYVEGLDNRGFIFQNPNAKDTCGCGTSFSA